MAVNRLTGHFGTSDSESAGERASTPGFFAVPLTGIPHRDALAEARSLYDFAWFLAQVGEEADPATMRRWLAR